MVFFINVMSFRAKRQYSLLFMSFNWLNTAIGVQLKYCSHNVITEKWVKKTDV